jgi:hypothetical protein
MLTRANFPLRLVAAISLPLFLFVLFFTHAAPASAQGGPTDARWQAWLGCWTPASTLVRNIGKPYSSAVCIVPTAKASAVDVVAISNGKVVDRTHVDTDGQPHAISKEGCTGSESAKWSPSARRVYLRSDFTCTGAPATHLSAIYAMAGGGEWIDVQGMRVDKNVGVRAIRYRDSADLGALPGEVTQKLPNRVLSRMAAMLAVSEAPSIADIAEASRELDAAVVSTWLIEIDKVTIEKPAPLSAKQLVKLADSGVPASVIDVMVGLSYPKELVVNPENAAQMAGRVTDGDYSPYDGQYGGMDPFPPMRPLLGFDRFGFPVYAADLTQPNACSLSPYSPYSPYSLYSPYDMDLNAGPGCPGYGYSAFMGGLGGYPFLGGYPIFGGFYGGAYGGYGAPVVAPRGSGAAVGPVNSHGRVVNGRGYSQGTSGSTGTATPRSGGTTSASASPPPPPARTAAPRKP